MKIFTFLKTFLVVAFALIVTTVFSKEIDISSSKTELKIQSKSASGIAFKNNIEKLDFSVIQNLNTDYSQIVIANYAKTDQIGYPSLPVYRKLMEIPVGARMKVKILSYDLKEYKLEEYGIVNNIFPCQGPQSKCSEDEQFVIDIDVYQKNAFIKSKLADAKIIGSMRSQRLALVEVSPFEYNPVEGVLRVYNNLQFEVVFENADYSATNEMKTKYYSPYFTGMQQSVLNYIPNSNRENLTQYPVKYVIVSDPMFETSLQPLIEWKKQKGFNVVEAYTDEIGTTKEAIKTYLQTLYDNGTVEDPAPSFVLFVGDINQMPTYDNGNGVTDRNYVEYTGDLLPEIFYGRMSAETADQLDVIIGKTLQYEQYTMPDPTYLDEVVMVAGVDSGYGNDWANGQINYGTENYFNEDNDIISHTYLYPESGSQSSQIHQDISNGVTFANYTAHCSPSGWADPSFVISDIANLANQDKYGLLIGNCCSSSEYQTTCFAEEIVRAENKGAVGYIGGSNSTYWDEDYYFGVGVGTISEDPPAYEESSLGNYDRSFHSHGEDFGEWYTTMDQVIFAGNLAVLEGSPGSAEYYWDIYNLIGDPSLMIYFSNPDVMPVTHDDVITIGQTSFTVNTAPFAYLALNKDGINYATALADENGVAELVFDGFTTPGYAELVITAQNYQPWIEDILVFAPDGPFCIYESYILQDDSLGNGNVKAEFDEDVFLNINIKNYGTEDANGVVASLSSDNEYVTLIDTSEDYNTIAVDESEGIDYGFHIKLANNIPDQMQITFNLSITDQNDSTWTSNFKITSYAPCLNASNLTIDDNYGGNGNGLLDPGETAILTFKTKNTGHCIIDNVTASLQPYNQYVTVISGDTIIPTLGLIMPSYTSFEVIVDEDAPEGIFAEMHYQLQAAGYDEMSIYYPKISQLLEDWESGNFSKFQWQSSGDEPWQIISEYPFEGFYHAASGDIGNDQTSEFYIQYEVMGFDSIRFEKKISSEQDYDYLIFYIDNNEKAKWSGSQPWTEEVFAVSPGIHTFKWSYEKDYSQTGGSDKAWVDYISLPTMMVTTVFAGSDDYSCQNSEYICQGTATNYDSIWWTTSGSGSFENINSLNANYIPSDDDILNGNIQLMLNVLDVDSLTDSDEMNLTFVSIPDKASTPDGDVIVDLENTPTTDYEIESIPSAVTYNWQLYPQWAGTIDGNSTNITVNWNLEYDGETWLKVAGINDCGMGEYSDSLLIMVNPVGINSANAESNLLVMPNPNTGNFKVQISRTNENTAEVVLINNLGQEISKQVLLPNQEFVDFQNINSGVYILLLKDKGINAAKKIIVK